MKDAMKIVAFLPNWVGDAVMATPALRGIRDHFQEAEIVAVVRPPIGDVVAGTGLVDRVLTHRMRSSDHWSRGWRFAMRLRAEAFDTAVLFPNSLRSAWLAYVAGARRRVGFARDARQLLLTDALIPKSRQEPNPVLDEYIRLARQLGCDVPNRQMELAVTGRDEVAFRDFSGRQSDEFRSRGIITLNPGGAFGAAKHWPIGHFAELATRISNDLLRSVLVLCGPAEREQAREIVQRACSPYVSSLANEQPSLGLTKAAIRSSELLVTTDSGPRHFAAPFGVPVVTLFGPTHIAWSETFDGNAIHLQHRLDCGPCQKRVCPLGHHRCMTDLLPDRVFEAVRSALLKKEQLAA